MFINLSNHPSELWDQSQRSAALGYGSIADLPFPQIPASFNSDQINPIVEEYYEKILSFDQPADHPTVMVQGEFTFVYRLLKKLEAAGIPCVAACTERVAEEQRRADGTIVKESVFRFVQFRAYY